MTIPSVNWEEMEWVPVRPGVERKAFSGQGATLALHRLQPGHEPKPHNHVHEQIVYIVSGKVDFHIGDEVLHLGPGSLAVVPSMVMHHAVVIGDEPAINLDVFTPSRPEYA